MLDKQNDMQWEGVGCMVNNGLLYVNPPSNNLDKIAFFYNFRFKKFAFYFPLFLKGKM